MEPQVTKRRLTVDISVLRESRDFRLLWFSTLLSETGRNITLIAVFSQIYRLTHSAAAVGAVGLFQFVPLFISTIGGGSIVDAIDRRKTLLVTQVCLAASSALLLWGSLQGRPPIWLIYLAVSLSALFGGLSGPTRSAMVPNLVRRDQLPTALAINQVMWNMTMLIGPVLGGFIIAHAGFAWAYGADFASYAATIVAAWMMKPMVPGFAEGTASKGFKAIGDGFRFLKGHRIIQSTFAIDLIAMIFGMPRALFPILAEVQFHRGAEVSGLLFGAPALGAIIGAATAGWVDRIKRQGWAVVLSVAVWGAGITAFGLVGHHLWLALFFLAVAGAADVVSAVFRSTIFALSAPDALRGRLSAINILVVAGGPRLGDLEAGLVAAAFSPTISVVSGGLACIAGTILFGLLVPQFRKYRA